MNMAAAATLLELLSAVAVEGWRSWAGNTLFANPLPRRNITKQWEETAYTQQGSLRLKNQRENGVSVPAVRRGTHWAPGALARQMWCPEVASIYWFADIWEAQRRKAFALFSEGSDRRWWRIHLLDTENYVSFVPHLKLVDLSHYMWPQRDRGNEWGV